MDRVDPVGRIGLRDAVEALRKELTESIEAGAHEELRFEVGEVTLHFQLEVERTSEASGGVRFWVVELGGTASRSSTLTHSITIPLKPVSEGGGPVLTGSPIVPD